MIRLTYYWSSNFSGDKTLKAMGRAARKAGGEALRFMRAEASRQVRAKKRFRVSAFNKATTLRYPSGGSDLGDLEWSLNIQGDPMPVSAFRTRQTARGVSAFINVGKTSFIKSAFLATMKSGHQGVFFRQGKTRLPIDEAFTSRITDPLNDEGVLPQIQEKTMAKFETAFARLLTMELGK